MKNISSLVDSAQKLLKENSPVILTGVAVAGTFATAFLTFKGTQKATEAVREAETLSTEPATNQDKFLLTWKFYAPAAAAVVGTSACMIFATKISLNRTAALAGAFVLANRDSDKYQDKVRELLGEKKDTQITDAVANDQVAAMKNVPVPREGEQTFIDAWTGRPISTTMEKMERGVNEFNKNLLHDKHASLNEFYAFFDMDPVQEGYQIGWNIDNPRDRLLDLKYTTILKDDRAVVSFKFGRNPMPRFQSDSTDDQG